MPEEKEISKIEIRSEEVQDILGNPPKWIIRWGISIMFLLGFILIVGSYYYKYPEIIKSTIVINTENMPAIIVAKSSGKLEELLVNDKQQVTKNTPLAVIENGANLASVTLLQQKLDIIREQLLTGQKLNYTLPTNLVLGDIQSTYQTFVKALKDYEIYKETNFLAKKAEGIETQIAKYHILYIKLKSQTQIYKQQLEIGTKQLQRDSILLFNKVISLSEWEQTKNVFFQTKLAYENSGLTLDNTQISISQLEQSLLEIKQQVYEQKQQILLTLESSMDNLQNQIKTWHQVYVLATPISGKVTFIKFWSKNQNVQSGNEVFAVVPSAQSKIVGKIKLPIRGSGKVKEGQIVNIKLDNYPYLEYGMVIGRISSVSLMPSESYYSVEVEFPNGLTSNYHKKLAFGQNMEGSAEIITEDIRLIERFIQPLKYFMRKNE